VYWVVLLDVLLATSMGEMRVVSKAVEMVVL